MDVDLEKIDKKALKLARETVKKHSFGELIFLTRVGPRAWGFSPDTDFYDHKGIYLSKEDNIYWISIPGLKFGDGYDRHISLTSLEGIVLDVLLSSIQTLISINSPIIYASKEFLRFKKWVNSNFSKQIYEACQTGQGRVGRGDYLRDFFFVGNGISILEGKKVIANLLELNKKILKIPAIDELVEEEKIRLPFEKQKTCKEIQKKLKTRLREANKNARLPERMNSNRFKKLKIMKKINFYFWYWPEGSQISREKDKKT